MSQEKSEPEQFNFSFWKREAQWVKRYKDSIGAQKGGAFRFLMFVPDASEGLVKHSGMYAQAHFWGMFAGFALQPETPTSQACLSAIVSAGECLEGAPARPQEADTASGLIILQAICFKVRNLQGYMSVPHLPWIENSFPLRALHQNDGSVSQRGSPGPFERMAH